MSDAPSRRASSPRIARAACLLAVAIAPIAPSLDYGLGSGATFRSVVFGLGLTGLAACFLPFPPRTRERRLAPAWPAVDATELLIALYVAVSAASAVRTVLIDGRDLRAQAVGLAVGAGHALLFWAGRRLGDLPLLVRAYVAAMLCAGLAGVLQWRLLETGVCAPTEGLRATLDHRCLVGGALTWTPELGRVRLPGTASSPWHWSWTLTAASALSVAVLRDRRLPWRCLAVVTLLLALSCAVLSGQRLALVLVPLAALLAGAASLWRPAPGSQGDRAAKRRRAWLVAGIGAFLLTAVTAAVLFLAVGPARKLADDFVDRWRASPPTDFVVEQWRWAVAEKPGWLGYGPGSGSTAARHFEDVQLIESMPAKRLYELGWLGLLGWYATVAALLRALAQAFRDATPGGRATVALLALLAAEPYWYPLDTDPSNLLFWLLLGAVLRRRDRAQVR